MKNAHSVVLTLFLAVAMVALVAAQTSGTGADGAASGKKSAGTASRQKKAKKLHLPANFSADDAYKQNCTRCHAEVPKLDAKRSNTIMRHMQVRANLTKDEAQAILEYLK